MERPLIQLFRTPNNCYLFETNKNEFLPISEPSYDYLWKCLREGEDDENPMPQELQELKAQGYLATQSVVQKVCHPYTKYLKYFLDRKIRHITLQLTQSCNFRCKYCVYSEEANEAQRTHSNKVMSWEVAKKAVDFLWKHSLDSEAVNIGFYGGEPLLAFPLIQKVIEYSKERFAGKELSFNMTCNGTLLSDEIIHYLAENHVLLMISLDGPKEINDLNRVFADGRGTFDTVMERIFRLREIEPAYAQELSINSVVNPQNGYDCINAISFKGQQVEKLHTLYSMVDFSFDGKKPNVPEDYFWKAEYQSFLAILSHFDRFPRDRVSPIATDSVDRSWSDVADMQTSAGPNPEDAPAGPCIPGQSRMMVDVSGRLFPCERVSETSPAMCIGNLDDGFNVEQANELLNVGRVTENACKRCWCFRYCMMCVRQADGNSDELLADVKLRYCYDHQAMAFTKLRFYLLAQEVPIYYAKHARHIERKDGKAL